LTAAYSLLVNFNPPKREDPRRNTRSLEATVEEEDGMTFVQSGEVIAGTDGVTHTGVNCFRCEHKGHYADKCPNGPNATLLQTEAAAAVTLLQASHTEVIVADDDNANKEVSDFTFTQLPSRHELTSSFHRPGCCSTASRLFRFLKTRIFSLSSGAATVS
jgi:hypothetical protein